MLSFFPRGVLDKILNLIESVSEGFPSYSLRWSPNSRPHPPPPEGIIGLGLSMSTILLEIVLGDRPDDLVDVLPGFKLKWQQKHANQRGGIQLIVQETPRVQSTLEGIQHEADFRLLNLDRLNIGPVFLKRLPTLPTLRFKPPPSLTVTPI